MICIVDATGHSSTKLGCFKSSIMGKRHIILFVNDTGRVGFFDSTIGERLLRNHTGGNIFRSHTLGHFFATEYSTLADMCAGGVCRSTGRLCFKTSMACCGIRMYVARTMGYITAAKDRCIIEGTSAVTTCHLIPLAPICGSNNAVRRIRIFVLRSTVKIYIGRFAISCSCCGTDVTTVDLRSL